MIGIVGVRPPLPKSPDGTKIFTVKQTGQPTVELAAKWVGDRGGDTLLLEQDAYFMAPDFIAGSTLSTTSVIEWDRRVSVIGRGSQWTRLALRGTFNMDASKITDTNPYFAMHCSGGSDRIHRGYRLDCGYNGSNSAISFSGARWDGMTRPVFQDLPIIGVRGTKNIPPEETHVHLFWTCASPVVKNTWIDSHKLSATIFSNNKCTSQVYSNCGCFNANAGHGFSSWGANNITYIDCETYGHGTGTGSQAGAAFNHEETKGSITHLRTRTRASTLCGGRFEEGYLLGGQDLQQITLTDCDWQGSPYPIRLEDNQLTMPTISGGTLIGTTGPVQIVPGNRLTYETQPNATTSTNTNVTPAAVPNTGTIALTSKGRTYHLPGNVLVYDNFTVAPTNQIAVTAMFRTPVAKPTASLRFLDILDATSSKFRVIMTNTGVLQVVDASGANVFLGTQQLNWDTDYTVQLWITVSGTAAVEHFDYYVGDQTTTPVETGASITTGNTGTTQITTVRVGQNATNTAATDWSLKKLGINTAPTGYMGHWTSVQPY